MQLNRPEFWSSLIRVLNEYVQIDNWVVLVFGDHAVRVISLPEVADSEEIDAFIHRYVKGLYLLDPFYIADRENPQSGFFHLLDIAPEHFRETEYYQQYLRSTSRSMRRNTTYGSMPTERCACHLAATCASPRRR